MMGNPPPRIFETEGGIINSIGLQNPGFQEFIKNKLPYYQKFKNPSDHQLFWKYSKGIY